MHGALKHIGNDGQYGTYVRQDTLGTHAHTHGQYAILRLA